MQSTPASMYMTLLEFLEGLLSKGAHRKQNWSEIKLFAELHPSEDILRKAKWGWEGQQPISELLHASVSK